MIKRLFFLVIVLLSFAAADKPMFAYEPHPIFGLDTKWWNKQGSLKYAYAPSTIYYDHKFHQFYCSSGGASDNFFNPNQNKALTKSFDHIRYRTSKDGSNWSAPRIVMTVKERSNAEAGPDDDLCACDPAVIYGDDGYWYMLYGSNAKKKGFLNDPRMWVRDSFPLVIYLARARFVQGPYFRYTDNGWEDEIYDANKLKNSKPKIVLGAATTDWPEGGVNYRFLGAAQPTIVRKDNKFYVWYRTNWYRKEKNSELCISLDKMCYVYHNMRFLHVVVDKLTDLPQIEEKFDFGSNVHIITGNKLLRLDGNGGEIPMEEPADGSKNQFYDGYSIFDVRYNVDRKKYEMWTTFRYFIRGQGVMKYESDDGIDWTFVKYEDLGSYNYIHNVGVSGDAFGVIRGDKYLISFSAPYPVDKKNPERALDWSDEDLRNIGYNIEDHRDRDSTLKGSWGMWQQLADKEWKTDIINYLFVGHGFPPNINADKAHYFTGDFDGDGVSDLGAVDKSSHKWYLFSSRRRCYMDWEGNCKDLGFGEILIKNTFDTNGELVDDGMTDDFEIITGDYDGDGKTDIGAVDRANSRWYIRSSRTGGYGIGSSPSLPNYIPWGWQWGGMSADFKIIVGDYNGDGITDRAIYNGSNWYIISSLATEYTLADGFFTVRGGTDNFIPWGWSWEWSAGKPMNENAVVVAGDFDGDGITDRAVYEKNSGKWTSLSTRADRLTAVTWRWLNGKSKLSLWRYNFIGSDHKKTIPIVGDYDGDGVDDLVHVEKSTGKWVYFSSLEGRKVDIGYGWKAWKNSAEASRIVLVGDFDGDGVMDPAFVDRENRMFYVRSSRTGEEGIHLQRIKYVSYDSSNDFFAKKGADPIGCQKPIEEPKAAPVVSKAPSMNVAVDGKKVTVTNVEYGSKVAVFDMLGKRILEAPAGMNAATFEVPTYGKYIVRAGAQSRVIMVK